jgi:hypothetical protein
MARWFLGDFDRQTFETYIETVALFAIEVFVLTKAAQAPARSWKNARGKSETSNITTQVPGLTKAEPALWVRREPL